MTTSSLFRIGLALAVTTAFVGAGCTLVPQTPPSGTPAPVAVAPTVAAASITKVAMSRTVDDKGNATAETAIFNAKTDKTIYAVLTVQNVTKNTKLSYVRKLNGKFIDSKVAQPSADGVTNFFFAFEKGIGSYPTGTYTLDFYVNGKLGPNVSYLIK